MKQIFLFLVLLFTTVLHAQEVRDWEEDKMNNDIELEEKTEGSLNLKFSKLNKVTKLMIDDKEVNESDSRVEKNGDTTTIDVNAILDVQFPDLKGPKVEFVLNITDGNSISKNFIYKFKVEPPKKTIIPIDIAKIPLPRFEYLNEGDLLETSKKNRILIIDATPNPYNKKNNTLYKKRDDALKMTNSIPVNSSLSILIKNYSFINIEETSVNINDIDYSYADDLGKLYQLQTANKDSSIITGSPSSTGGSDKKSRLEIYLNSILKDLESIEYMNINDLKYLQSYQDTLGKVTSRMKPLSAGESSVINAIRSWRPDHVSLTPIALTTPDTDEVELKVSFQYKGSSNSKEHNVGTYKTSGGLAVGVNSNIYITNLKNNEVYTDSVMVDGNKELRATMDDNDDLTIGIGMNSELSFRTGSMVRPTINVGFFIPIGEEDISPFLALGPGISIGSKKVKFSLSGGWAFGKINKIAEKYKDKDLSLYDNLSNENLSEKVWKSGWQIGIGLSYNLTNK